MTKNSKLTAEQIACIYAWLAQLFSRELNSSQLEQLQSTDMVGWFAILEQEPLLSATTHELKAKIDALAHRPDAQLELAADFCSLFLMSDKQSALPYASVYPSNGQNNAQITCLLLEAGIETSDVFNEPSDHLSIFLELLSHLHFSLNDPTVDHEKVRQLRQQTLSILLSWLPTFSHNCQRYDEFGFYGGLSQLLLTLVQLDEQDS